jgi:hypothetical protein
MTMLTKTWTCDLCDTKITPVDSVTRGIPGKRLCFHEVEFVLCDLDEPGASEVVICTNCLESLRKALCEAKGK